MKTGICQRLRTCWSADFLSPKDLVRHAVLIGVMFAVAHWLGLREFTSILNGTIGSVDMNWQTAALLGLAYILLYFAWIILVPILLLAAILLTLWGKVATRKTQ